MKAVVCFGDLGVVSFPVYAQLSNFPNPWELCLGGVGCVCDKVMDGMPCLESFGWIIGSKAVAVAAGQRIVWASLFTCCLCGWLTSLVVGPHEVFAVVAETCWSRSCSKKPELPCWKVSILAGKQICHVLLSFHVKSGKEWAIEFVADALGRKMLLSGSSVRN